MPIHFLESRTNIAMCPCSTILSLKENLSNLRQIQTNKITFGTWLTDTTIIYNLNLTLFDK